MPTGLLYLLEDGDGIPPSGSTTTDTSPTLGWGASGGVAFNVSITSGSQFISSGTVATTRFTVPVILSIGSYQASLDVLSSSGSILSSASGTFDITAWLRPPRVYQTSDIVPAEFSDPPYIRYLPQWMPIQRGVPTSGSLLFQFFLPFLKQYTEVGQSQESVISQASVLTTPVNLPRLWWHTFTSLSPRNTVSAIVSASGTSGDIRQVATFHEFVTAEDPVFLIGDTGHVGFRNLITRLSTVSPVGTSGTLATQYWIPGEGLGIVPDTDVLFSFPTSGTLWRIPAGSPAIDPYRAVIQLSPPFSGDITFQYQSLTFASDLVVSLSGGTRVSPSQSDLWNRFDELGILAGITRKFGEDNLSLKKRLHSRFASDIGTDRITVAQHVAQDLILTDVIVWDGRSILDFVTSGYYGVRRIDVVGIPEIGTSGETLTPGIGWEVSGTVQFFGSKTDWQPGWLIVIDGIVADNLNYPGLSVSGNVLTVPNTVGPLSGVVKAYYQFRNFTQVLDSEAFVSQVVPVSGNLTSGNYIVLLTRNTRVFTPADPQYQRDFLLTPNGLPNGAFLDLREKVLENSPVHIGRARWGKAFWSSRSEFLPPIEHLPVPWDFSSIVECAELTAFGTPYIVPPSGLTVTPSGAISGFILRWSDNSSQNDGLTFEEDGFSIERSLDGIGGWSVIGTVGRDVTVFLDTGHGPGDTFFWRVRAFTNL